MEQQIRAHAIISGRVQGVCFRMETTRAADRIGVSGWVRNLPDGTVEAVFEGEENAVRRMLDWCRQGPPAARVKDVTTVWEAYTGEWSGFSVTY